MPIGKRNEAHPSRDQPDSSQYGSAQHDCWTRQACCYLSHTLPACIVSIHARRPVLQRMRAGAGKTSPEQQTSQPRPASRHSRGRPMDGLRREKTREADGREELAEDGRWILRGNAAITRKHGLCSPAIHSNMDSRRASMKIAHFVTLPPSLVVSAVGVYLARLTES